MPPQGHGLATLAHTIHKQLHLLRVGECPDGVGIPRGPVPVGEGMHQGHGGDKVGLVPIEPVLGEPCDVKNTKVTVVVEGGEGEVGKG
jgi:hypothetical protein